MRLFRWLLKQPVPKQIERYSRFSPSPLSIKQFLDFGECGTGPPTVATVLTAAGRRAAAFQARRRHRGSPQLWAKSVGTAGGALGCPGAPQGTRISGRGGGQGLAPAHRPGLYLETQKPRPRTFIQAGLPEPALVASNLLDTDLPVLKT